MEFLFCTQTVTITAPLNSQQIHSKFTALGSLGRRISPAAAWGTWSRDRRGGRSSLQMLGGTNLCHPAREEAGVKWGRWGWRKAGWKVFFVLLVFLSQDQNMV